MAGVTTRSRLAVWVSCDDRVHPHQWSAADMQGPPARAGGKTDPKHPKTKNEGNERNKSFLT
jgi:hypothetical protein